MYNTTQFWNIDGQPATEWTSDWAADVIKNAPQSDEPLARRHTACAKTSDG